MWFLIEVFMNKNCVFFFQISECHFSSEIEMVQQNHHQHKNHNSYDLMKFNILDIFLIFR